MSSQGDAAHSRGDIMRELRRLKRQVRQLTQARSLESASIGSGGLTVRGDGRIVVGDGDTRIIIDPNPALGQPVVMYELGDGTVAEVRAVSTGGSAALTLMTVDEAGNVRGLLAVSRETVRMERLDADGRLQSGMRVDEGIVEMISGPTDGAHSRFWADGSGVVMSAHGDDGEAVAQFYVTQDGDIGHAATGTTPWD